jgi:hypothetical protein
MVPAVYCMKITGTNDAVRPKRELWCMVNKCFNIAVEGVRKSFLKELNCRKN